MRELKMHWRDSKNFEYIFKSNSSFYNTFKIKKMFFIKKYFHLHP